MHTYNILILAGSVRSNRRAPSVAQWVGEVGATVSAATFQIVEVGDLQLGLGDEPGIPAAGGGYASEATRAWSRMVTAARGVVMVTPQYNWGYPAALKNAVDHLYHEWRGKPVLIVTYGSRGGGKCGAQLRQVMTGVHARLVSTMPALPLGRDRVEADDGEIGDFARQRRKVEAGLRKLTTIAAT